VKCQKCASSDVITVSFNNLSTEQRAVLHFLEAVALAPPRRLLATMFTTHAPWKVDLTGLMCQPSAVRRNCTGAFVVHTAKMHPSETSVVRRNAVYVKPFNTWDKGDPGVHNRAERRKRERFPVTMSPSACHFNGGARAFVPSRCQNHFLDFLDMILLMTESASPLLSFWLKFLSSKVGARSKPMGISAILVALYLQRHVTRCPKKARTKLEMICWMLQITNLHFCTRKVLPVAEVAWFQRLLLCIAGDG
jgi:hypothetical protein